MKSFCLALGLCSVSAPAFAACYQGPLEVFFKDFAADIAVQEAVTPDRLSLSQLDHEADPEPRAVERQITRDELEWPLVPNQTMFERSGGSVRFETHPLGKAVTLSGDSGYLMTLVFAQTPCWQLQAIVDESM